MLKFLDEKAKKEPKKYNAWFSNLGFFLKEGVCSEYAYKQELAELLRYESSSTETASRRRFASTCAHARGARQGALHRCSEQATGGGVTIFRGGKIARVRGALPVRAHRRIRHATFAQVVAENLW